MAKAEVVAQLEARLRQLLAPGSRSTTASAQTDRSSSDRHVRRRPSCRVAEESADAYSAERLVAAQHGAELDRLEREAIEAALAGLILIIFWGLDRFTCCISRRLTCCLKKSTKGTYDQHCFDHFFRQHCVDLLQ